jgi:hypothetical protein
MSPIPGEFSLMLQRKASVERGDGSGAEGMEVEPYLVRLSASDPEIRTQTYRSHLTLLTVLPDQLGPTEDHQEASPPLTCQISPVKSA